MVQHTHTNIRRICRRIARTLRCVPRKETHDADDMPKTCVQHCHLTSLTNDVHVTDTSTGGLLEWSTQVAGCTCVRCIEAHPVSGLARKMYGNVW